jgi:hypothetical protein
MDSDKFVGIVGLLASAIIIVPIVALLVIAFVGMSS